MQSAMRLCYLVSTLSLIGPASASAVEHSVLGEKSDVVPVNWASIPARTVALFYPGQSSYQWLRGPGHPAGMAAVSAGAPCSACHTGQEPKLGERIVAGGPLEPEPISGKRGLIELRVQAAYDDRQLYLRIEWPTQQDRPGQVHDFIRWNGESWTPFGGPRSKAEVRTGAIPALYEDRVAIALGDASVGAFERQGCWLACHDGMRDMPQKPAAEEVRSHALLGQRLGQEDVRKYLPDSRTDKNASWNRTKSEAEIAELKALGQYLDLMQWRAHRSNPVGMADDGFVLEYRLSDAGTGPFASNFDREKGTPRYMFDAARAGYRALSLEQVVERAEAYALIREENAAPYAADADWRVGDLLPSRVLSRSGAEGSAADNRNVVGSWKQGLWTVIWARPLDTGSDDDKPLRPGERYTVSFAVHDDNTTSRYHHVSFPLTLGLGTEADIRAAKVE